MQLTRNQIETARLYLSKNDTKATAQQIRDAAVNLEEFDKEAILLNVQKQQRQLAVIPNEPTQIIGSDLTVNEQPSTLSVEQKADMVMVEVSKLKLDVSMNEALEVAKEYLADVNDADIRAADIQHYLSLYIDFKTEKSLAALSTLRNEIVFKINDSVNRITTETEKTNEYFRSLTEKQKQHNEQRREETKKNLQDFKKLVENLMV